MQTSPPATRPNRRDLAIALAIFLVALLLRSGFVAETLEIPVYRSPTPGMDIDLHWQGARLLNQDATTDSPYFELMQISAPLHVHWLAFLQKILGDESLLPHRLVNAFIGSLNAVLAFLVLRILIGRRLVCAIVALVWAGLPSLIYFDTTLHKSVLALCVYWMLMALVLRPHRAPRTPELFLEGAGVGLLTSLLFLSQMNTFLYLLAIVPFLLMNTELRAPQRLTQILGAVLVFAAIVVPFQNRTSIANQAYPWYLPLSGIHLRLGFHEGATGGYSPYKEIDSFPYGHTFQARLYVETQLGRSVTPWEADRFLRDEALIFVTSHPSEAMRIALAKVGIFFNNFETKGVEYLDQIETDSRILAHDPLGFGILVVFAGVGIVQLVLQRKFRLLYLLVALVGASLAANVLTFVTWRYRLHALVPLTLLAGLGVQHFIDGTVRLFGDKASASLATVAGILLPIVFCGWLTYRDVLVDERAGYLEQARFNADLSVASLDWKARLAEIDPDDQDRDAQLDRAMLHRRLHQYTEAFELLQTAGACDHPIERLEPCRAYVLLLIWLGNYDEAARAMGDITDPTTYLGIVRRLRGLEGYAYRMFVEPRIGG